MQMLNAKINNNTNIEPTYERRNVYLFRDALAELLWLCTLLALQITTLGGPNSRWNPMQVWRHCLLVMQCKQVSHVTVAIQSGNIQNSLHKFYMQHLSWDILCAQLSSSLSWRAFAWAAKSSLVGLCALWPTSCPLCIRIFWTPITRNVHSGYGMSFHYN